MTQSAKLSDMYVANFRAVQIFSQSLLVKLGIVPRARNAAHIYDASNTMRAQNRKKFFPRAIGMSNGKDGESVRADLLHGRMLIQRRKSGNVRYGI